MGFMRKLFGGGSSTEAAAKAPSRAQPETVDLAEICWQTMQDLVSDINKSGPSGTLAGIPLQRRVKLRDDITVIGERLGTDRNRVKARPKEYISKSIGQLCRNLADQAKVDPFCAQPLDPDDAASVTIAERCGQYADEVHELEREVEHERKMEHDRRRL
jgi:hypothetical protein